MPVQRSGKDLGDGVWVVDGADGGRVLAVNAGDNVQGFLAGAAQGIGELGRCTGGSGADMGEVTGWILVLCEGESGVKSRGPGDAGGVMGAAMSLLAEAECVLVGDVFAVEMET